eukprot:523430_1
MDFNPESTSRTTVFESSIFFSLNMNFMFLLSLIATIVICFDVPTFDIGLFQSIDSSSSQSQQELCSIIDSSFQSHGILKLVNTSLFSQNGIHRDCVNDLNKDSINFFNNTSMNIKMKYNHGPPGSAGYLPPLFEGESDSKTNLREIFAFYSVPPNNTNIIKPINEPPILYNSMSKYWFLMQSQIIYDFGKAVLMSLNITNDLILYNNLFHLFEHRHLIIAYYYEINENNLQINDNDMSELRHLPHHDGFGFTFLWTDNECGLQFYSNQTNEWIDAQPDSNSIFVLNGDLIPFYTNNRWKRLFHRVVKCKNKKNVTFINKRIAFVMFTGPDFDAIVSPWILSQNDTCNTNSFNMRQHIDRYFNRINQYR